MKKLLLILLITPLFWGCEKVEFSTYPNWLQQGKWKLMSIEVSNSTNPGNPISVDSVIISEKSAETYGDMLKLVDNFKNANQYNKLKKGTFWEFVTDDRLKILVNPYDGTDGRKYSESEIPIDFLIGVGSNTYDGFKISRNGHRYLFSRTGYSIMTLTAPKVVTMVRRNGNVEIFISEYTTLTFHNQ